MMTDEHGIPMTEERLAEIEEHVKRCIANAYYSLSFNHTKQLIAEVRRLQAENAERSRRIESVRDYIFSAVGEPEYGNMVRIIEGEPYPDFLSIPESDGMK